MRFDTLNELQMLLDSKIFDDNVWVFGHSIRVVEELDREKETLERFSGTVRWSSLNSRIKGADLELGILREITSDCFPFTV